MNFHRWCYKHAHWFFKWASGYAYDFNMECNKLQDRIEKQLEEKKDATD